MSTPQSAATQPGLPDFNRSPLSRTSTNFATHKLYVEGDTARFKPTVTLFFFTYLFYGILALFGLGALSSDEISGFIPENLILPVKVIFVVVMSGVFFFLYRKISQPIAFSNRNGWFWKGQPSPDEVLNVNELHHAVKLDRIAGLQMLSRRTHSTNNRRSYVTYELNLIFKDGERLHVIAHGGGNRILFDADELSDFLGVPVVRSKNIEL